LKTSEATGAAQGQLGPRAQALAAPLNTPPGLTLRSTCRVLPQVAGLRLSPGGLAPGVRRVGHQARAASATLSDDLRRTAAVFAAETSGSVGGPGSGRGVFPPEMTTVSRVEPSRGRDVVTDPRRTTGRSGGCAPR
jgi:hypothetical protein